MELKRKQEWLNAGSENVKYTPDGDVDVSSCGLWSLSQGRPKTTDEEQELLTVISRNNQRCEECAVQGINLFG